MRRCDEETDLAPCQRYGSPSSYGVGRRRSRRGNMRGTGGDGGGAGSVPDLSLYGETGYSASSYRASSSGGGEAGVATGFLFAALARCTSQSVASTTRAVFDRFIGGAAGWSLQATGTNSAINAVFASGAGVAVTSNAYTLTASDIGRILLIVAQHTGTGIRLSVMRAPVGSDVAITGYTAAAISNDWGARGTGTSPADGWHMLSTLTAQGTPNAAQVASFYDAARVLGDLPSAAAAASLLGSTITHRTSMRDQLAGAAVVNGQASPASLTDTVTGAAGDALAKVGTGLTVVKIDPTTIDGRRTLGAQGFSASNCLQTANGKGIRGSASLGGFIAVHLRPDVATNMSGIYAEARDATSVRGAIMGASSSTIDFNVYDAAGTLVQRQYTVPAGDVGQMRLAIMTWQPGGYGLRGYVNGVQVGADLALATYQVPLAATPTMVGRRADGTFPLTGVSVFGGVSGNAALTPADVAAMQAAFDASGRIPLAATGKETWGFDLTADILASGLDAVPAVVLDRVGTDHLTRQGIAVQTDANSIRAVGPYSAADGWQTAPGGGIQGSAAGFHLVVDIWLTKIPTAQECVFGCTNGGSTVGHYLQLNSASIRFVASTGAQVISSSYTITNADLNKRLRIVAQSTGTALQLFVLGAQAGADVAFGTYSQPSGLSFMVSGKSSIGSQLFSSGYVESVCGGNAAALTSGEIAATNSNLTAPPPVIPGKTDKRYIFEQDIAAAGGLLPGRSVERISGGDDMVRAGSGLTLAQLTARLWSYETSPVMYGGTSFTDADDYAATDGFIGSAAGYWISFLLLILNQSTSANRIFGSKGNALAGWSAKTGGLNSTISFTHANGVSASIASAAAIVSASDVGKVHLYTACFDPSIGKLRAFHKRTELSQSTAVGYTPATDPAYIGRYSSAGFSSGSSVAVLAMAAGNSIISAAEHFAQYDACMAQERMVGVPGKTDFLVDFTLEKGVPATLLDRVGSQHMTRQGSPAQLSQYARAWGV